MSFIYDNLSEYSLASPSSVTSSDDGVTFTAEDLERYICESESIPEGENIESLSQGIPPKHSSLVHGEYYSNFRSKYYATHANQSLRFIARNLPLAYEEKIKGPEF